MARIEVEIGDGLSVKSAQSDDTLAAFDLAWGPSPLYGEGKGVTITYCDARYPDKVTKVFLDVQILAAAYTAMLMQMKSGTIESYSDKDGDEGTRSGN